MKKVIGISASLLLAFTFLNSSTAIASTTKAPIAKKCVAVKNVVGKNYQKAQDIWRGQGFWVLPAKDATGQGRMPWIDSAWFVTAQSPKAGTCIKKGGDVRATVKKYTD